MTPNQPQTNKTLNFYRTPFKINNTNKVNNCKNVELLLKEILRHQINN